MKKIWRFLAKRSVTMLAGFVITGLGVANVLGHLPSDVVQRLDYLIYDVRLRADVATPVKDDRIVIVDIDEKSLKEVGRWPWSRAVVAKMVTELTDNLGAAVVAFDVVFAEPEQSDAMEVAELLKNQSSTLQSEIEPLVPALKQAFDRDAQLADVIKQRPVVLGYYFNQNENAMSGALPPPLFKRSQLGGLALQATEWQGYGANLYKLQRAADGGYFNPILDSDGTVRSVPLMVEYDEGFYQSLALATLRTALGNPQVIPVFPAGVPDDYGALEILALRSAELELDIPIQRGMLTLVNYRAKGGPEGGGYEYISASDILAGTIKPEAIAGRIVLVGTTAPGLLDLRSTPVNPAFPGVEVHANVLSSMLDGKAKLKPEFAQGVLLISVVVVGLILSFLMPFLSAVWSMLLASSVLIG
ncbi:MAG: CHASE2 domain-containing protein, partial [Limnobacter sp.]|nr:CHASE2 domain-containing protein [Limnobacter sp.]